MEKRVESLETILMETLGKETSSWTDSDTHMVAAFTDPAMESFSVFAGVWQIISIWKPSG